MQIFKEVGHEKVLLYNIQLQEAMLQLREDFFMIYTVQRQNVQAQKVMSSLFLEIFKQKLKRYSSGLPLGSIFSTGFSYSKVLECNDPGSFPGGWFCLFVS